MSDLLVSIGVIFVLLLVGFLFSAAEMALVTLRDSQIQRLQAKGKRGRAIMDLTDNPNRFLSSVPIGVTRAGSNANRSSILVASSGSRSVSTPNNGTPTSTATSRAVPSATDGSPRSTFLSVGSEILARSANCCAVHRLSLIHI